MGAPMRDPDRVEKILGADAALRGRDTGPEKRNLHVHAGAERGQQVVRLEDDSHDMAPVVRRPPELCDVLAVHHRRPGVRPGEAGDDLQQRALARPRGAPRDDQLAGSDAKRHAGQCLDRCAVALAHSLDRDLSAPRVHHLATLRGGRAPGIGANHGVGFGVSADVPAWRCGDHRGMAVPPPVLLPLPGFEPLAARAGLEIAAPEVERFPNGELSIRLLEPVEGRDCFLLGTAAAPGDQLVSLLLAADSLVRHGARSVRAVMPYLAYTRQDRLEPHRSLAAAWLGSVLAASRVEDVVTIAVHRQAASSLIGLPVSPL